MGDLTRLDDLCLSLVLGKLDNASLVALQMTCRGLWEFMVRRDAYVWLLKLKSEFDYRVPGRGHDEVAPDYLGLYRRLIRQSQRPKTLRFMGIYTNGSVDPVSPQDQGMWPAGEDEDGRLGLEDSPGSRLKAYWADNAFKEEMSPFCSVVGRNVDVVGVLLNGHTAMLGRERRDRAYMQRRTRFARFWLRRMAEEGGVGQNLDEYFRDFPTDHQLRSFFLSILEWYELGRGIGQTLFMETDDEGEEDDAGGASGQLVEARGVRERLLAENRHLGRAIVTDPKDTNIVYDSSLIDGLIDGSRSYRRCVVERFVISRAGDLTCPVKAGFVFGAELGSRPDGTRDGGRQAWVAKMQQSLGALRMYDNIMRLDMVMERCDQGLLPRIEAIHLCESGDKNQEAFRGSVFVEFTREERVDGCVHQWFPIGFFLFDVGWRNGPSTVGSVRDLTELAGRQVSSSMIVIQRSTLDHDVNAGDAVDWIPPPPDPWTEMNVCLHLRRMLDAVAIKLVAQENRMEEMDDLHEAPNIDLTRFLCEGICVDPDARVAHRYLTRAATAAGGDVAGGDRTRLTAMAAR